MMHSPLVKIVVRVAEVICALCAVHVGLQAFGYDAFSLSFLANLQKPIEYAFGIAGIIALVTAFMCSCMDCSCSGK